jgi:hypothetical protein
MRSCVLSQLPACVGTLPAYVHLSKRRIAIGIGSYFTPKSESPMTEAEHLHKHIMTSVAEAAAPSGSVSPDTAPSSVSFAGATTLSGSVSSDTPAPSSEKGPAEVRAKV